MNAVGHDEPDREPEQAGADRQPGIDHPSSRPVRPQKQRHDSHGQQDHPGDAECRLSHGIPRPAATPQDPNLPKAVINRSRA